MKNTLFFLFVLLCFSMTAQDAPDAKPIMFESIILDPNPQSLMQLRENLRNHNMKYHGEEGPYQAYVYNIATGPNVGKLVWMMGPCGFEDLDNRPSAEGHDEDWVQNVVAHLNGVEHGEYWERDNDLSREMTGEQYPMYYIRYHNISRTEGYRARALLKKISTTMKTIDMASSWAVYDNLMRQGYETGRHIAMVSGMKTWAEMNDNWGFAKAFEAIHGENSFPGFQQEMQDVITNSWDEIWVFDPYMSGREE